jgi:hypothetical protein
MIKQLLALASVAALLTAVPASAQESPNGAAGIAALGLTAALLRSHQPPPIVYPAPAVIYPRPPVVVAPPVAGEPAFPDLHP